MITFEFTASHVNGPVIFQVEVAQDKKDDMFEAPLSFYIPHSFAKEIGLDNIQRYLREAVDLMVEELNKELA